MACLPNDGGNSSEVLNPEQAPERKIPRSRIVRDLGTSRNASTTPIMPSAVSHSSLNGQSDGSAMRDATACASHSNRPCASPGVSRNRYRHDRRSGARRGNGVRAATNSYMTTLPGGGQRNRRVETVQGGCADRWVCGN